VDVLARWIDVEEQAVMRISVCNYSTTDDDVTASVESILAAARSCS
jgi:hypothetical protein